MGKLRLVKGSSGVTVLVSGKDKGVTMIAQTLVDDIVRIADPLRGSVRVLRSPGCDAAGSSNSAVIIVAGILGESEVYDGFAELFPEACGAIKGKRECYFIRCGKNELFGDADVIYVFGSDKVGCEYGLLYLSEKAGVSPWHYWADVIPEKKEEILLDAKDLNVISREPSVEYRGFFLNDEWPSLGTWVTNTFGRFDENFYKTVFDLLLRLRGNFLWPAMWAEVFAEDGTSYPQASADLATDLGITMGTSHHEPLFRAGEEFSYLMTDSNDVGYGKDWSYYTNARGIYKFWEDGVKRDRDHKALVTIGMRGERDSLLLGENATMKDNVDLLKKAITDQKKILADNGLAGATKVLALYKEVEDYYYGDKDTEGLCSWSELDDTLLLLSDDNFGNLRSVPDPSTRNRKAGWGIYYHLDYHGDPISYEWVNSTPVAKVRDQLTRAYGYGIRRLWIVNVGDLRPVELPLNYFMDLAYDIDRFGKPNTTFEYMRDWTAKQFPGLSDELVDRTCALLDSYTRFNGDRRPEATHPDTFSFVQDEEALAELERSRKLYSEAVSLDLEIPEEYHDRFYGLVEFPAKASANLRKMMILAGAYDIASARGLAVANRLKDEIDYCVALDKELVNRYNEEMSGGKWRGMMGSKHVDFKHWNDEESCYPAPSYIEAGTGDDIPIDSFLKSLSQKHGKDVTVLTADEFISCSSEEDWLILQDYGRSGVSVTCASLIEDIDDMKSSPWIEFGFDVPSEGEYKIMFFTAPSNNPYKGKGLRFGYAVDANQPVAVDTLPEGYMAGYGSDKEWCRGVLDNARRTTVPVTLDAGHHTLRFFHLDAGMILQKIDIGLSESVCFYGYRK
ncbi:MAG: glycosyl hydrolase 115 family protein [Clostridiales bacterium]|nr:glycosyl hydrolase 115 family protein [Clostridiales bacterium]